jgi:uncharacterized protein (TIGR03437 family)
MKKTWLPVAAVAICLPALSQTPTVANGGILNVASYSFNGLPNSAIAQGSLFTVFLTSNFPVQTERVGAYPVPTTFRGFSMRVTIGGQNRDVPMFFVAANQIGGIMPSDTPVGTGELRVTYNGTAGPASPIRVVARSVGIFTLNQAGSGPGVVTNSNFQAFTPTFAANPGETGVLWTTGVGPITTGDTTAPPAFDQNPAQFELWVGNVQAQVAYRGRAPGLAGTDQVNFTFPQNVSGCYVPIRVRVGDIVSNTVTVPVAVNGRRCSDPNGLTSEDLANLQNGALRTGIISLSRTAFQFSAGPVNIDSRTDFGAADFERFTPELFNASQGVYQQPSNGACVVFTFRGDNSNPVDPVQGAPLDAGPFIEVTGPAGTKQLALRTPGHYDAQLGGGTAFPGGPAPMPDFLNPGQYTIVGQGGRDVGPFRVTFNNPAALTWTNRNEVNNVVRAQGQRVTWTGGDPAGFTIISGASSNENAGAGFICIERTAAGQFTVPGYVLLALPPSQTLEGVSTGSMFVGSSTAPARFTANGLDVGLVTASSLTLKQVGYN